MMKPKFTRATVSQYFNKKTQMIERIIVRELLKLAEECVNKAKEQHSYMDQTGNLTSSIGFELYVNGISNTVKFEPFVGGSESGEYGVSKGISLTSDIGPNGKYSLIFVAAMPYAEEVEARGKMVLTPAYLHAEQELPKLKQRILNLINAA